MIVVCSIHQPRSNIFSAFDKVMLLKKGRMAYYGPRSSVVKYFEKIGENCALPGPSPGENGPLGNSLQETFLQDYHRIFPSERESIRRNSGLLFVSSCPKCTLFSRN